MENNTALPKLIGKIVISFKVTLKTGMHIGGSKSETVIGGVDSSVIKDANGKPYIPGSSLKGKLRGMLAKQEGSPDVNKDSTSIKNIFGESGANDRKSKKGGTGQIGLTRLVIRDAPLDEASIKPMDKEYLYDGFVEVKTENRIMRDTGAARDPRTFERVPAGAAFDAEVVYSIFDNANVDSDLKRINTAIHMLELDYIGGSGSRGYGQVVFSDFEYKEYAISEEGVKQIDEFKYYKIDSLANL